LLMKAPFTILVALFCLCICVPIVDANPVHVLVPSNASYVGPTVKSLLESEGYVFDYTAQGVSPSSLIGEDIVLFADDRNFNDPLDSSQVSALQAFLASGKGILIFGEQDPFGPQNVTNHASFLGVTGNSDSHFENANVVATHPTVNGLSSIY